MAKDTQKTNNRQSGWISLHRKIENNWIYPKNRPFTQFEAWIDLLLNANHEESEVTMGKKKLICKRGESFRSVRGLAKKWGWEKSKVERYLALLRTETQIKTQNETQTTRITICNYDHYQCGRDTKRDTNRETKRTQTISINNINNKPPISPKEENEGDSIIEKKTWRNDYSTYLTEMNQAYEVLVKDEGFIKQQEKFHPGIDIRLSLDMAKTNFWGTDSGWENKKSQRSKDINWKLTFTNAIKMNKVYKPKNKNNEKPERTLKDLNYVSDIR